MTFALCRTAKESAGMQRAPPRTPVAVRGRTGMGRGRRGEVRGKKWNEIGARCALARRSRILLSLSLCLSVCLCLSLAPLLVGDRFSAGTSAPSGIGPPLLGTKQARALGLKWSKPTDDGGLPLLHYTLYWDEGIADRSEEEFVVLYQGKASNHKVCGAAQHAADRGEMGKNKTGRAVAFAKRQADKTRQATTRHDKPRKWNGMEAEDVTRRTAAA